MRRRPATAPSCSDSSPLTPDSPRGDRPRVSDTANREHCPAVSGWLLTPAFLRTRHRWVISALLQHPASLLRTGATGVLFPAAHGAGQSQAEALEDSSHGNDAAQPVSRNGRQPHGRPHIRTNCSRDCRRTGTGQSGSFRSADKVWVVRAKTQSSGLRGGVANCWISSFGMSSLGNSWRNAQACRKSPAHARCGCKISGNRSHTWGVKNKLNQTLRTSGLGVQNSRNSFRYPGCCIICPVIVQCIVTFWPAMFCRIRW